MWGFLFFTLLPLFLATVYVGCGARVMTFSVMNRVPLKIAPNAGEWMVQSIFSFFLWPLGLALMPDLRPALQPMNRRERERLGMQREREYMKDSVAFAAERHEHTKIMDKLHDQKRTIDQLTFRHELESSQKHTQFDPPELREETGEVKSAPEVPLGKDAQELLHKSQAALDKESYMEEWGIKVDYNDRYYIRQGCTHAWLPQLIECETCSPVHRPVSKLRRESA